MIVQKCSFDPVCDLHPVDQFGFIDLKSALESSVVPSQMPGAEDDYNGIDDPSKVLGSPKDIFEAIDSQRALEAAVAAAAKETKSSSED